MDPSRGPPSALLHPRPAYDGPRIRERPQEAEKDKQDLGEPGTAQTPSQLQTREERRGASGVLRLTLRALSPRRDHENKVAQACGASRSWKAPQDLGCRAVPSCEAGTYPYPPPGNRRPGTPAG
eukprot:6256477-Pyramimonas_sp.AAC.1